MFNLLVSGNGEWWEVPPFSLGVDRFKEHSGAAGRQVDASRPETLRALEEVPTLLMYEVGAAGPHARVVRHGRVRNVTRRGRDLTFDFEPDPERAYVDRKVVLDLFPQLGADPFEQHRTHWAIKDGALPEALLAAATAERAERTLRVVAGEYVEAVREGPRRIDRELREELESFPPSLDKALLLLPARVAGGATPELYPLVGVDPRTPEGRNALDAVLRRDAGREAPPLDWPFSLAWFLATYGSRTEASRLDAAVETCSTLLVELQAADRRGGAAAVDVARAIWRVSRDGSLAGRLRREVAALSDLLSRRQAAAGCWQVSRDGVEVGDVRATALAVVALQRLGDDRHHGSIASAVDWLVGRRQPTTGALPRLEGDLDGDVVATALAMEAVRRSKVADDVPHVLEAGDAWLLSEQTGLGGWEARGWSEDAVVALVVGYLGGRSEMLAQVDGHLLMARAFFRKAEELRVDGGANNRRLAAIAAVHAVEMFLYGVFGRREDLGLSAFRENGIETVGPREALRSFEGALQRFGIVVPPRRLRFRDNVNTLVGQRDGIIHRAHEIGEAELEEGMRCVRSFMTIYGRDLLGLDLLQ